MEIKITMSHISFFHISEAGSNLHLEIVHKLKLHLNVYCVCVCVCVCVCEYSNAGSPHFICETCKK